MHAFCYITFEQAHWFMINSILFLLCLDTITLDGLNHFFKEKILYKPVNQNVAI